MIGVVIKYSVSALQPHEAHSRNRGLGALPTHPRAGAAMSDMWASTGETIRGTCSECGSEIVREKLISAYTGMIRMQRPAHTAPCGLPCEGAGVPMSAYRAGRVHYADDCPECTRDPAHRRTAMNGNTDD